MPFSVTSRRAAASGSPPAASSVGSERPEIRAVLERDGNRCLACGFCLKCALSVHHRLPKELGRRDTLSNLITLCWNCHKIVHWLSVGERLEGPEGKEARHSYGFAAFARLRELAEAIRDLRVRTRQAGNRWVEQPDTDGLMPLTDALNLVSRRNHFDQTQAAMLR
jgi:HNH endonuclease